MTTYNTQNPVGSADPRDLYDNAQVIDDYANSASDTTSDRLGVSRRTLAGMNNEYATDKTSRDTTFDTDQADRVQRFNALLAASGYVFLADYAAGIEVTEYNEVIRDTSGNLWRASAGTDLPYTTTGAGLPEGGAFVSAGDAVLRNDLAAGVAIGQGALLVRGSVIYVDTIADLQALPVGELVDGQQVQVKEYHAGTGVGGGELYWDVSRAKADHDGGLVIDPDKIDDIVLFSAWISPNETGEGCFVRRSAGESIATTYQYGGLDGEDCSAVCQHLINLGNSFETNKNFFITSNLVIGPNFSGSFIRGANGGVSVAERSGDSLEYTCAFAIEDGSVKDVTIEGFDFHRNEEESDIQGFVYLLGGGQNITARNLRGKNSNFGVVVVGSNADSLTKVFCEDIEVVRAGRAFSITSPHPKKGNVLLKNIRHTESNSLAIDVTSGASLIVDGLHSFRTRAVLKQAHVGGFDPAGLLSNCTFRNLTIEESYAEATITTDIDTGNFILDETIVGATTGATAKVHSRQLGGSMRIKDLLGTFSDGEVITGNTSGISSTLLTVGDGDNPSIGLIYTTTSGFDELTFENVEFIGCHSSRIFAITPTETTSRNHVIIRNMKIKGMGPVENEMTSVVGFTRCSVDVESLSISDFPSCASGCLLLTEYNGDYVFRKLAIKNVRGVRGTNTFQGNGHSLRLHEFDFDNVGDTYSIDIGGDVRLEATNGTLRRCPTRALRVMSAALPDATWVNIKRDSGIDIQTIDPYVANDKLVVFT